MAFISRAKSFRFTKRLSALDLLKYAFALITWCIRMTMNLMSIIVNWTEVLLFTNVDGINCKRLANTFTIENMIKRKRTFDNSLSNQRHLNQFQIYYSRAKINKRAKCWNKILRNSITSKHFQRMCPCSFPANCVEIFRIRFLPLKVTERIDKQNDRENPILAQSKQKYSLNWYFRWHNQSIFTEFDTFCFQFCHHAVVDVDKVSFEIDMNICLDVWYVGQQTQVIRSSVRCAEVPLCDFVACRKWSNGCDTYNHLVESQLCVDLWPKAMDAIQH